MRVLISGVLLAALVCAGDSRLSEAAARGDKTAVRSLLQQGADIDGAQGDGTTALHWAAFNDDLEMANLLIAAGANVKVATRAGAITPLFMACQNGDAAMIAALLKAGAQANSVKENGTTALMMAAASGSAPAVQVLLDHGASVNAKESVHGQTALMFAAALNRDGAVKALLAGGADPNIATNVKKLDHVRFDQDGNVVEDKAAAKAAAARAKAANDVARAEVTAFGRSIGLNNVEFRLAKPRQRAGYVAARPPRKVGADFMGGMTALLYACREGHMETVRALIESGKADINQTSGGDKFSPLVEAIVNGHL